MAKELTFTVNFGKNTLNASISSDLLLFNANMKKHSPLEDVRAVLIAKLDKPIGTGPLKNEVNAQDKVLILIEDNTRNTPVAMLLPIIVDYLEGAGVKQNNIEILVATGTHRVMTEAELLQKVGPEIVKNIKVSQHDYNDKENITFYGVIKAGSMEIPVHVNKKVLEADYVIGLGNIIPHCDAGFSGGAKIVQPGVCGFATTAATHIAAALLDEIPLGNLNNPCRLGIEEVAGKVGLKFIINVVMAPSGEVIDVFAGDFIAAHRAGAMLAEQVYGVEIPELADIVIVSSQPGDVDFWQGEKALISAYFCVKKGGIIIFVAPCYEGMEHNHPRLKDWVGLNCRSARERAKIVSHDDENADLVAADIALGYLRVREKASILSITEGLCDDDIKCLGFKPFKSLQSAVDYALEKIPGGKIGLLPRGGDCLPIYKG